MRIPVNATPEIQQAFRELHQRLDRVLGPANAANADLKGKRFTNAGEAEADSDLVTLRQVNDLIDNALGEAQTTTPTTAPGSSTGGGGGAGDPGTCNSTKPDYTAYVTAAKATLVGLSEDLTGPCGAFKIVKLAARNIQAVDNTVGLLAKDSGTNCVEGGQGYSVDVLCFIDGAQYDILGAAGDGDGVTEPNNHPQFNFIVCGDPDRYRSPLP